LRSLAPVARAEAARKAYGELDLFVFDPFTVILGGGFLLPDRWLFAGRSLG
jgi:hypothetical protein